MRLAVLADVHGNLPALEAVLADVQRQGADGIIVAGDLTAGPQPVETMRLLRSLGSWMIRGNNEPVLVCGHTHIPWKQEHDGRLALNPGAVCGSLNGDVRAQYALLTWQDDHWQVDHQAVPYDLDRIRAAFRESGLLAEGGGLARAFLLSIETAQNVGGYFLAHAYGLAAEAGFEDCDVVPNAIWEHAVATFDWDQAARSR